MAMAAASWARSVRAFSEAGRAGWVIWISA
jgi:hypothetical protein